MLQKKWERDLALKVEKLSAPMGAAIRELDVKKLDNQMFEEVDNLFCEHQVLVFPDQELTPEEQMRFASRWGSLIPHPYAGLKEFPQIIELKNRGKRKDVNQHWHTDMSYNPLPPKLTMLYAHDVPKLGGDTAFCNQVLAYQEISAGLRSTINSLSALHSAQELAALYGEDSNKAPQAEHPVVRTHDATSLRALYVCRAFTKHFVGWSVRESRGLLEYLFEQSTRIEFQFRHRWRKKDLVMWDNRSVLLLRSTITEKNHDGFIAFR